jgi:hypothetical protein
MQPVYGSPNQSSLPACTAIGTTDKSMRNMPVNLKVAIEGLYVIQGDKHNRFVVLASCPALGHLVAETDGALADKKWEK